MNENRKQKKYESFNKQSERWVKTCRERLYNPMCLDTFPCSLQDQYWHKLLTQTDFNI